MGRLRLEARSKTPGFMTYQLEAKASEDMGGQNKDCSLKIRTRRGVTIFIPADMSLRQVARFVRLLEAGHDLG